MKTKSLKTILAPQGLALNIAKAGRYTEEQKKIIESKVKTKANNTLVETPNFGLNLDKKEHQFVLLLCELMASSYAHSSGTIKRASASKNVSIVPNKTDKGKAINEAFIIEIPLRELVKKYYNLSRPYTNNFKEVLEIIFDSYEMEGLKDEEGNPLKNESGKKYLYGHKIDSNGNKVVKQGLASKKYYVSWTMKQQNGKYSQQFTHEELLKVTPILSDLNKPEEYNPNSPEHSHAEFIHKHRNNLKLRIELNAVFALNSFLQIPANTRERLIKAAGGKNKVTVEMYKLIWYLWDLKRQKWAKKSFLDNKKQSQAYSKANQNKYLKQLAVLVDHEAAELLGSITENDTAQINTIIEKAPADDRQQVQEVINNYFGVIAAPQGGQLTLSVNLDTLLNQLGLMELYKGRKYTTVENGNQVQKVIKSKPKRAKAKIVKAFEVLQKAGFVEVANKLKYDKESTQSEPIKWEYVLKDTYEDLAEID